MLRVVMKSFNSNVPLTVGDIVDVSSWRNRAALEQQGYIGPTDAKEATVVDIPAEKKKSTASSAIQQPARKPKRSPLASRPRVFRKAKQGE